MAQNKRRFLWLSLIVFVVSCDTNTADVKTSVRMTNAEVTPHAHSENNLPANNAREKNLAQYAPSLPSAIQFGINGVLPLSVNVPFSITPEQARPWFDVFSWQSFLAMQWPSLLSNRGEPVSPLDPSTLINPPAGSTPVFSSYKEAFELFGQGDSTPTPWSSYDVPVSPCPESASDSTDHAGNKTFVMVGKSGTLLDEINEAFSFPLVDQNSNYTWSEVRFNEAMYNFILMNKFYLAVNLAAGQPIDMPESADPSTEGALMVKATWRVMTAKDDLTRYQTVQAQILNPTADACIPATMGLVGMHIVQKLKQFPQWIWSSFEQVDNLAPGHGAAPGTTASFNNSGKPNSANGWDYHPALVPPLLSPDQLKPVQVSRVNEIPTTPAGASTVDINRLYQSLLAQLAQPSPLAYYQLIITQWPTNPEDFRVKGTGCATLQGCAQYPADSGQPFPVDGATNTVMETYVQTPTDGAPLGGNSCMSCHYDAGKSDYSWVLQNRAH